ncbi:MAG: hypothetical protein L0216_08460 [Planctomycetales bacterium]|nr:hypothetical protein [Planctomycetales bacterium]
MTARAIAARGAVYVAAAGVCAALLLAWSRQRRSDEVASLVKSAGDLVGFGLFSEVEAKARAALDRDPQNARAHLLLAIGLVGEVQRLRRVALSGRGDPPGPEEAARSRTEARAALDRALDLGGDDPEFRVEVADWATTFAFFDVGERLAEERLARPAGPGEVPGERYAPLFIRGAARHGRAHLASPPDPALRASAEEDLSAALREAPGAAEAARVGDWALENGLSAVADAAGRRVAEAAAEDPRAPTLCALAALAEGRAADAAAELDRAVELLDRERRGPLPESPYVATERMERRANVYFRRGRLRLERGGAADPAAATAAAEDLLEAERTLRGWPLAAHDAARALLAAGDAVRAGEAISRALSGRSASLRDAILAEAAAGAWDSLPEGPGRDALLAAQAARAERRGASPGGPATDKN